MNASSDIYLSDSIQDPWEKAIGVFDLTAMEWKDDYDPDAPAYVTPDAVKDYYRNNGEPVWDNDVVKRWFTKGSLNQTNSTTVPDPDRGPASSAGSSGTNGGAIAGGTVGGVAGLALIAFSCLYMIRLRRRRRRHIGKSAGPTSNLEYDEPEYRKPELATTGNTRSEMDGSDKASEMAQKETTTSELPANVRSSRGSGYQSYQTSVR